MVGLGTLGYGELKSPMKPGAVTERNFRTDLRSHSLKIVAEISLNFSDRKVYLVTCPRPSSQIICFFPHHQLLSSYFPPPLTFGKASQLRNGSFLLID